MAHKIEKIDFKLEEYIEKYIQTEYIKKELKKSDLILLPYENFRDQEGPLFPENFIKFYDYCKENLINYDVEICIEESNYKEVVLHSNYLDLGKWLIKNIATPVIVGLVIGYAQETIGADKLDKTNIKLEIIEKDNYKKISYEGDVEGLKVLMEGYKKNETRENLKYIN